jgi:hypothetical protein
VTEMFTSDSGRDQMVKESITTGTSQWMTHTLVNSSEKVFN